MIFMLTDGVLGAYVHGNRIGVLVDMQSGDVALAKDIAMHVAAMRPEAVNADDVPAELIEKKKQFLLRKRRKVVSQMKSLKK